MIAIGGKLIHRAELWAASRDRWTLEIAYSDTVLPSGKVTVEWGSAKFVGTIDPNHVGMFAGEVVAKIIGGFGWSNELPATWYQSDSPGLQGQYVATKAAEAVGETLYGATGTAPPATNLFRPLRVSYSRTKQTAGSVLEDVLAPGVAYWTDFDGSTRAGVRVAPLPAARVELIEYDAASKWADIEADDPANLLGATIPADAIRGTPALVINELFAWAGEEGFRYRVAVSPAQSAESSRLATALRDIVRGFVPELPALELRRARVVAQASDGRVSVQQVDRSGEVADFGRTEGAVRFYTGLPGASAELNTTNNPETILAFTRADWSEPIAFLAPPVGQPGHVPINVFLEASSTLRFVGNSAGIVKVGADPTTAVALAGDLVTYLEALEDWALQIDLMVITLAGAIPFPIPPPPTPYSLAIDARTTAADDISSIPATKLEAK